MKKVNHVMGQRVLVGERESLRHMQRVGPSAIIVDG